jgi:predicted pyridoxine 5'-phosphate oxidase superfamily flavin-nucleotide-binding protein
MSNGRINAGSNGVCAQCSRIATARSGCTSTPVQRGRLVLPQEKLMQTVMDTEAYHCGMRRLQERFATRRLADRLDERLSRSAFSAEDRAFIESRSLFFLATADASGHPDCSFKGGDPGFVRVTGDQELAFPSYDGNGMFRSLGNVLVNPAVALLFIDFEKPGRLRVNGYASVADNDELLADFAGAQLIVRVRAGRIFPNCPRYIHRMATTGPSPYVPRAGYTPPQPNWKRMPIFADVLPPEGGR